jgi:hypothetical protein
MDTIDFCLCLTSEIVLFGFCGYRVSVEQRVDIVVDWTLVSTSRCEAYKVENKEIYRRLQLYMDI